MKKIYPYLTYAGTIPFIFCTILLAFGINQLPVLGGAVANILSVYTLIILSFLAGSHWGQHFNLKDTWGFYLPIFSNLLAVALWAAFLIFDFKFLLVTFSVAFVILLFIDYRLLKDGIITNQYFKIRFNVTTIAVLMLILAGIS